MNELFDTPVVRSGTGCVKWDEHPHDDLVPLWVADMDFRTAPAIIEALQRRVEHGVFGYTLVPESYYEAIIAWFHRRHQWTIDRSWIQYTSGVVPALSVIVKALTQPGDQVILQTPVYNCFFSSVRNNGCEVVANGLELKQTYTMDFDDLERKAADPRAKMLILCNPHNPAGRVWTREELTRVYNICKEHGVIVVSDEIHNELTYRGRRYVPYGVVSQMDNAIVCTSPSKSFNTAGLQIANIICANAEWRERIDRAINQNEVCDVNPFGVVALQAAYNESEEWLDQLCEYIYQNYEALCQFLAERLPQLRVLPLEGTYLVWVDISALGITADELTSRLLSEAHVQVNSGTMYDPSPAGQHFIRLNIACPRSQLMEGLRRLLKTV
ncbi:MAG: pyridoxal phosphate-dependent aminotransferase [Prevotella sp.]|nr:pyridoxal phosphate-dependent aminotransferase [Prevotella sp.]